MPSSNSDVATSLIDVSARSLSLLRSVNGEPRMAHLGDDLLVLSHQYPSDLRAEVYDPVVCLVVQGAKQTHTAARRHTVAAGQFLVVTHDMPVTSRITQASPDEPYVALIATLDRELLVELLPYAAPGPITDDDPYALRVGEGALELVDAFHRLLIAHADPADAEALAPLVRREIHYRLLRSPHGEILRRLALGDRPAEPIAEAIAFIRGDLAAAIGVPAIARHVGLSTSALHHHFKAVTGTTPVQYQKRLRLLEARRLIQANRHTVTDAAYAVGYASATQFSREYRRAFGHPPSQDRQSVPVG